MPIKNVSDYIDKTALMGMAEDSVRNAYLKVLKPAILQIVADTDNKFDDMIGTFLPQLDAFLLPLIDKIDGEVG